MVITKSISRIFSISLIIIVLIGSFVFPNTAHAAGILYVTQNGTGDCSAWLTSCSLQTALTNAISGDEIWVAAGTYKPTTGTNRNVTFQLKDGVSLYGGFAGIETLRAERDIEANITILTGDLNGDDNFNINCDEPTRSDNSLHVVSGANNTTLDGFIITGGNANIGDWYSYAGGGMQNVNSNPILTNVIFTNNSAVSGGGMGNIFSSPTLTNATFNTNFARSTGGGIINYKSNPTLTNVTFNSNFGGSMGGGGLYNIYSSPIMTNVTFKGNSANSGGGMLNNPGSSPILTNVTFSDNMAASSGGGMYTQMLDSSPTLINVTFSGNSAISGGGMFNDGNPIMKNVTFASNSALYGGGIYNNQGNLEILNTIFWGNTASVVGNQINFEATNAFNINDSVIQGGCPSSAACSNIKTTDPFLGILGDYGGNTQTIPLLANSSAINTGNDLTCAATDQRGIARPQGAHCDIGAFELVDIIAPDTTIIGFPGNPDYDATPTFNFSGDDGVGSGIASFMCRMDSGTYTSCASPFTSSTLADGSHTFYVYAIDLLDNADSSPASYSWALDTIAPNTTIIAKPSSLDTDNTPTFTFSGNDGVGSGLASFMCRMDSGTYTLCISPFNSVPLSDGSHTFDVYALDMAGNADASPASYSWTLDATAPDTTIITKPFSLDTDNTPTFTFSGDDSTGSGITSFMCRTDSISYTLCTSPFTSSVLADGSHTFDVYAIDLANNADASPASYSWALDTIAPDITIMTKPASIDTDNTPTFTFSGDDSTGSGIASFMCRMDSGIYTLCTSPFTSSALSDGSHTFDAYAIDLANNVDSSPASYSWVLDTIAPNTTIIAKPFSLDTDNTPTFTFSGNDGIGSGIASFMCRMDGGTYTLCTSPFASSVLADGSHTFDVYAIDLANNPDISPASYSWVLDTIAPNTTIIAKPFSLDTDNTPTFTFSGNDGIGSGIASFMCRMDGGTYTLCTSPFTSSALADGSHTFDSYAIDLANNADASPASYSWVLDTIAPDTTIITKPFSLDTDNTPTFTFTGNDGIGSGVASFMCRMDNETYTLCTSPFALSALADGLHTFDVYAIDLANIADISPASYSWTLDTTAPIVKFSSRVNANPTSAKIINFTVTFSETVTGVDTAQSFNDFSLTTSGVTSASITSVTPVSGTTYIVSVNTGLGNGTIRLNVMDNNSIADTASNPLGGVAVGDGNFTTGEVYTIDKGGDTTGVFRPGNGLLYLKNANTSGFADVAINYGLGGDYPVAGDWDGNGTATIGIYRNGIFFLRNSNTLGYADLVIPFGTPGDQPVVGDWDGDGVDTIGVYSNGQFLLRNTNTAGAADMSFYLGNPGDVGIAGDWNGDGSDTTGVFRPSNGVIFLKNLNTSGFADIAINYGLAGDMPVAGDWNNDGIDTIGVYRNAQFLLRNSNTIGFADIVFALGNPGDMPISGNWDGIP